MIKKISLILIGTTAALLSGCAMNQQPVPASKRPDVQQFIRYMHQTYHYNSNQLTAMFDTIHVTTKQSAQNRASQPVGRMKQRHDFVPWYTYQRFFVTQGQIDNGVAYWTKNKQWLNKAEAQYGLPPFIIVSTIGIESKYGKQQGSYPVFQSLAVLAFDYTPRKSYFKKELIAYLLYCRNNQIQPLSIRGSYAGAIGQPQFMPSNIARYGVDFSQSGTVDLINNDADAIGSVAHFYSLNHWNKNEPIASPAVFTGNKWQSLLNTTAKPKMTVSQFAHYGIKPQQPVAGNLYASLIALETKNGPEYWLAFHNFKVIKNYNNSTDYAMAIYQLGLAIQNKYQHTVATQYAEQHKTVTQKSIATPKKSSTTQKTSTQHSLNKTSNKKTSVKANQPSKRGIKYDENYQ